MALGLVVGIAVGLVLGVISGLWSIGEELVDPTMQMLRAVPFLALVPLFIAWFGIDETFKVVLIATRCGGAHVRLHLPGRPQRRPQGRRGGPRVRAAGLAASCAG